MKKIFNFKKQLLVGLLQILTPPVIIIVVGFFAFQFLMGFFQNTMDKKLNDQRDQLIARVDNLERGFGNSINVLQRQLDENSETIEGAVRTIPEPSFFQRLFNTELNRTRNEILDGIPDLVKKELSQLDLNVASTGKISLQVQGDTLSFPIDQKYLEGYWGEIQLIEDENEPYFRMILRPVDIDINEVRTSIDPILNQPRVFLQAVDRRTGEEIKITSTDFNFIQERERGFTFDPTLTTRLGGVIGIGDRVSPFIGAELEWLMYNTERRRYSFLSIGSSIYVDGVDVRHFTTIGAVSVTF